jgi:hypothetical protein
MNVNNPLKDMADFLLGRTALPQASPEQWLQRDAGILMADAAALVRNLTSTR